MWRKPVLPLVLSIDSLMASVNDDDDDDDVNCSCVH